MKCGTDILCWRNLYTEDYRRPERSEECGNEGRYEMVKTSKKKIK